MKIAFAPILLACCCLSAPALAETGSTDKLACNQTADDCKALRVAYLDQVSDCMTARQKAADQAADSTHSNSPQANRARHLLCEAEVRDRMGLDAK